MTLQRALNWAGQGWPVFPVSPENKRPLIEQWQLNATIETAFIRSWWEEYPNAGVGVVPGLVGCFVVDVDAKNGKDGFNTLAELEKTHGFETWDAPQQDTPSGGRHLLFRGTAKTSTGILGLGLDTRGGSEDGGLGYILAYRDEPPCYPAKCPSLPAELVNKLGEIKAVAEDRHKAKVELDLPANVTRAKMWLRGVTTPAQGERNAALFKTACTLKDMGLSLLTIFDAIDEYPHVSGDPPLRDENPDEFNTTVRSAWRNGQLAPGVEAIETGGLDAIAKALATAPPSKPITPARRLKRASFWPDMRSRPAPPWLAHKLIAHGSLVGLYGIGGSYKSFLALDLAAAVANGSAEWGGRAIKAAGPVVYVSGEGSLEPHLRAIEAHRKVQIGYDFMAYEGINLSDPDDCAAFNTDLQAAVQGPWGGRPPVLVFIDTWARATPNVEENSNKEAGAIVATLDAVRASYGCAVVIVHHTPKDNPTLWRGATAVWNALDTALLVTKQSTNNATLSLERQKRGATGAQWQVAMKLIDTGFEEDGEQEQSLVVDRLAPVDVAKVERIIRQREHAADTGRLHRVNVAMELLAKLTETTPAPTIAAWMANSLGGTAAMHLKWLRNETKDRGSPLYKTITEDEFYPPKENPPA